MAETSKDDELLRFQTCAMTILKVYKRHRQVPRMVKGDRVVVRETAKCHDYRGCGGTIEKIRSRNNAVTSVKLMVRCDDGGKLLPKPVAINVGVKDLRQMCRQELDEFKEAFHKPEPHFGQFAVACGAPYLLTDEGKAVEPLFDQEGSLIEHQPWVGLAKSGFWARRDLFMFAITLPKLLDTRDVPVHSIVYTMLKGVELGQSCLMNPLCKHPPDKEDGLDVSVLMVLLVRNTEETLVDRCRRLALDVAVKVYGPEAIIKALKHFAAAAYTKKDGRGVLHFTINPAWVKFVVDEGGAASVEVFDVGEKPESASAPDPGMVDEMAIMVGRMMSSAKKGAR